MVDYSDTPAGMISRLDAALARRGQTTTVRRYTAASGNPRPKTDIASRASVRPVRAEQMVGNITQTHSNAVLSPTGLGALLPLRKDDKLVLGTKEHNIDVAKHITVGDTLVRIDLVISG